MLSFGRLFAKTVVIVIDLIFIVYTDIKQNKQPVTIVMMHGLKIG